MMLSFALAADLAEDQVTIVAINMSGNIGPGTQRFREDRVVLRTPQISAMPIRRPEIDSLTLM
jgi:hypothetical protein